MRYEARIIKSRVAKAETPLQLTVEQESAAGEWLAPPCDLRGLEQLKQNSTILPQCIQAYKSNIAGFGISVRYKEDIDETAEMAAEFERAQDIIELLTTEEDTKSVFEHIIEARETFGIAFLEVIRDPEGNVCQIDFISDTPTVTKTAPIGDYIETVFYHKGEAVTRQKRFRKYRQQIGGNTVYFKEFGDPRIMDSRDGSYLAEGGELEIEFRANEIIEFTLGHKPYGEVRWLGQILGVDGSRRAENLNNNYFINGRHTPMMIVVKGGSLTDESFDRLQSYMDDIKGEAGQHAFMVLETEGAGNRAEYETDQSTNVEIKDLANILQKDELFQEYLNNKRRQIQSSFRLPDLYVGYTTDFNRATAQTAQEVTEKQVFQPERRELAWIINNKLLNGYNFKYVEAYFLEPNISNPDDLAKLLTICNSAGGLTPNKAKQIVYSAFGETAEDYEGDWANEPLARSQTGDSKSEDSPDISEQLEKQIAKAAAEHDDSVVAVMKEVRSLLKNFEKGFTKAPERGIIKEWNEDDHPRDESNGRFVENGGSGASSTTAGNSDDGNANKSALQEALDSGRINTKLNKDAQSKHQLNSPAYNRACESGNPPSYCTIKKMEIQSLINNYHGTGNIRYDGNQFKETIVFDKVIGKFYDRKTGEYSDTRCGTIHYSKNGTHLVPSLDKGE